ncbi:MAG: 3-phosphoshikimate 1-carboxyvinyltransferase [Clostridiales bacterium]|nr:3-phosphoshikimate 1-carboxyvinyltransferase [Clostridiales bacterium]
MISLNGQFHLNTGIPYGDKSVSHRALMLAAISDGTSVIHNVSNSDDVRSTAHCLEQLGVKIVFQGTTATVTPISKLPKCEITLDCGNSGTTARLLAGLVAGLGISARFVGDSSLSKRPMGRVIEPLTQLGARFEKADDCLFVCKGGKLTGATVHAAVNSAQVKSAVLLAGLFASGATTYIEKVPTRNHTERMLRYLGCNIEACDCTATVKKSKIRAFELTVPNDPSSAAYFVALALAQKIEITLPNVLIDDTRLGFYRVLQNSGANISFENIRDCCGEKVGDIVVKKSRLKPFVATEKDVCDGIDEIPILCTLALTVKGSHTFYGVDELRHKESDRIAAIRHIVVMSGQTFGENDEGVYISTSGKLRKNVYFHSFDDHRIAMCEVILSLIAGGGSVDKTPFSVSLPQFEHILGITLLRLGLIGQSVADSKSPLLMAHLAMNAGITCRYDTVNLPKDVSDDRLLKVIDAFDGLNVTMPHKNRVASLLKADVTSVNTVGRGIKPTSTDGYGIVQSLVNKGVDFQGKNLLVVGAGGAAEACVVELLKHDCNIAILNRTEEHRLRLQNKYNLPESVENPVGVLSFIPQCEYESQLKLPESVKFVLIADYKGTSHIYHQAVDSDCVVIDGLEMLYHQGAKSFALWTDTPVQNDYDSFLRSVFNTQYLPIA